MKINFNIKKAIIFFSTLSVAGACLGGTIYLQKQQLKAQDNFFYKAKYIRQEQAEKAKLDILKKMPTFGFNNLLADWSYLQFLQYFGDSEAREQTGYSVSPDYFEAVVKHDSRFVRAYFLLSPATSIFAGEAQRGVDAISKGLQSLSPDINAEAYYLWIYKGIDEMMFLGDNESAKKSYMKASLWAEQSDHPNAKISAANTRQTAQFLEDDPDSVVAQIGAWTMVLSSTPDIKTKQRAIKQIQALGGRVIAQTDGRIKITVPEN